MVDSGGPTDGGQPLLWVGGSRAVARALDQQLPDHQRLRGRRRDGNRVRLRRAPERPRRWTRGQSLRRTRLDQSADDRSGAVAGARLVRSLGKAQGLTYAAWSESFTALN